MLKIKNITNGLKYDLTHKILRDIDLMVSTISEDDMFTTQIEYTDAVKYTGDFAGLLRTLGVQDYYIPITVTVNGLKSSTDYDGSFLDIKLINIGKVDSMMKLVRPRNKK